MNLKAARFGMSVAALFALASCASISPDEAMSTVEVPATWSALSSMESGGAPSLTEDWLTDLNDPMVASLVGEALLRNQDLAATAARVQAARERVGLTRAGMLPSIGGSLGAVRSRAPGGTILQNGQLINLPGGYTNGTSLNLSLQWEMDLWGRLTDQTRAAYLNANAARLDLAATQLAIAGGTAQAFYALTEASLQRELSERDVETGEANLRIIERRYDRGISSSLDVRLARSSLASSQATLLVRQRTELEAARRLEVLLGRYPGAEIAAAEALPEMGALRTATGGPLSVGVPAELLFRRPDVLAAEGRLKAEGLDAAAARKALLPQLVFSGSARGDGTTIPPLFDTDQMISSIAGSLLQPIFRGGALRAQALAARQDVMASAATYAQTALTAYREVEDALAAERLLSAQLDAQRLAFDEAVAAEELTNRQYLNGTTNIFNLISAQQRRIGAESQFIAAKRARLVNRIDLYLALGAPFDAPADIYAGDAGLKGVRP